MFLSKNDSEVCRSTSATLPTFILLKDSLDNICATALTRIFNSVPDTTTITIKII